MNRRENELKGIWSGRLDSNQRPLAPEANALPNLRHAPKQILNKFQALMKVLFFRIFASPKFPPGS